MAKVLGIDNGTSNCCAALLARGVPYVIEPAKARHLRVTPTVVGLAGYVPEKDGRTAAPPEHLVGSLAKAQWKTNPTFTYMGLKRLLGRRFDDPFVQRFAGSMPFGIAEGPNGEAWLVGPDRKYSPEELLGDVLAEIKADAERKTGETISFAVIAAPAYFDTFQRGCITDAAKRAGLKTARIISEPTAAALAYSITREDKSVVAVYDFGGGTFDVTIMKVKGRDLDPLGSAGDAFLGGMDFDQRLVDWMLREFAEEHGVDLTTEKFAMQRLYEAAETTKVTLSSTSSHQIDLDYLYKTPDGRFGLSRTITRAFFEDLCEDLIERSVEPCLQALEDARKKARVAQLQVDEVVLVGGMTLMPAIRDKVQEIFGRIPRTDINPDEAVAFGCAIMGAVEQGSDAVMAVSLNERTTMNLYVRDAGGDLVPVIKRGTTMPASRAMIFTTQRNHQRQVEVGIHEGGPNSAHNVGYLVLSGIRDAMAEEPRISVEFMIDASGRLTVEASDLDEAGKPNRPPVRATIHTASGLTQQDLDELRLMADV